MPKQRAPDSYKAEELYKSGMKLVEIASKLNIPEGTVRRWKHTYKWDTERSDKKSERSEKKTSIKEEPVQEEVKAVSENDELTDKQKLFCVYFIKSFNATKAYQKAYQCEYSTALTRGSALLGNARIKSEIEKLKQAKLNRAYLSEEDVFQKYMDIAFADITDYVSFGQTEIPVYGKNGPMVRIDPETGKTEEITYMINTVDFRESKDVDGTLIAEVKKGKDGASIKLADKMKALSWIADHMDLATEKQKAEIALIKAKAKLDDSGPVEDDGFIDALKGMVSDAWQED